MPKLSAEKVLTKLSNINNILGIPKKMKYLIYENCFSEENCSDFYFTDKYTDFLDLVNEYYSAKKYDPDRFIRVWAYPKYLQVYISWHESDHGGLEGCKISLFNITDQQKKKLFDKLRSLYAHNNDDDDYNFRIMYEYDDSSNSDDSD